MAEYALLNMVVHGLSAVTVVAPPVLMGMWLVSLVPLGPMPLRWHFLLGSAVGLGLTSLLVLLLGSVGLLHRPLWIILMAAFTAVGLLCLRTIRTSRIQNAAEGNDARHRDSADRARVGTGNPSPKRKRGVLRPVACARGSDTGRRVAAGPVAWWLIAVPFASAALLAASNPPGLIWAEEGYGYDTLEYHLQLPKEYRQAGSIAYTPHNVYGSFPANVEMLYLLGMIMHDEDVDFGITANMMHLLLAVGMVYAAWVAGREWSHSAGIVCGVIAAGTGWLTYLSGLAYVENGMLFFGMVACAVLVRLLNGSRSLGSAIGDRESEPQAQARGRSSGRLRPPLGWVARAFRRSSTSPAATGGGRYTLGSSAAAQGNAQTALSWITLAGAVAGFSCGCKYTAFALIALPLAVMVLFMPGAKLGKKTGGLLTFTAATLVAVSPWLIKNLAATGNPVFPLANSFFAASPPGWGEQEAARWDRAHRPPESENAVGAKLENLWHHIPGDPYQRFGPGLFLLAFGGLLVRKRARTDALLVTMFLMQLLLWLFATHLYARFAVALLIPLILLAGRSIGDATATRRRRTIGSVLVAGCAWNFVFTARLLAAESAAGFTASLIYEGRLPGYEYLQYVNEELPEEARILLVGEARAFYFQRGVEYRVVFNRSPFVETVRSAGTDREIVNWLRQRGYTHVLVNWSEIRRLSGSYGFASEVTPALFERLSDDDIRLLRGFKLPYGAQSHVSIYSISEAPKGH